MRKRVKYSDQVVGTCRYNSAIKYLYDYACFVAVGPSRTGLGGYTPKLWPETLVIDWQEYLAMGRGKLAHMPLNFGASETNVNVAPILTLSMGSEYLANGTPV